MLLERRRAAAAAAARPPATLEVGDRPEFGDVDPASCVDVGTSSAGLMELVDGSSALVVDQVVEEKRELLPERRRHPYLQA